MNKYLVIILIIFAIIIIINRKKVKENMTSNTCEYANSLNINRGPIDIIPDSKLSVNEKCYFKGVEDSDLEINTLKSMVGKKLSKKQINIKTDDESNKFFNYQNFQIVKPTYENENSDKIITSNFNEQAVISRIPYLLHNDLFVRYYLSKINKNNFKDLNQKVNNFFNHILNSNVLKIDKLFYDEENDLKVIFTFDRDNQEKKKELEEKIVSKMNEIVVGYDKTKTINNFIETLELNKMKLIVMYQNNFLEELLNTNDFDKIMDTVVFVISAEERMINYLAKCINRSEPSSIANGSEIIISKINSSKDDIRHCSILGINKKRYSKDTRQILFDQIKSIYDNVYGLNEIPKLNISFSKDKESRSYQKNMSGDLIRKSFDSLLKPAKHNIKTVQTATSYFGLCDNIKENNISREQENININNKLKELVTLPSEEELEFSKLSVLKQSKMLITSAEYKLQELQRSIEESQKILNTVLKEGRNKYNQLKNNTIEEKINSNQNKINSIDEELQKQDISDEDKTELSKEKDTRVVLANKYGEFKEKSEDINLEDQITNLENTIYKSINLEDTRLKIDEINTNKAIQITITELKDDLVNSDYRKYYVALAVSDKIKEFTSQGILNEVANRNASTYSNRPNYKSDFANFDSSKTNRFTKMDYYPEADLIDVDTNRNHPCLKDLRDDEKPILESVFKCLIKNFTSIGISYDPYLAMDIALENCEPNAGILFLNKSRYFGMPKMRSDINKICNNYQVDKDFSNSCGQNTNCKIVKIVQVNNNNKCNVHIGQAKGNSNENDIVNAEYQKCLESVEKSNKKVTEKCNNDFPEVFPISVMLNKKIRIKKENINDYLKSIIIDKINNNDQTKSVDVDVIVGDKEAKLKANTLEDEIDEDDNISASKIQFESNDEIIIGDSTLKLKIPDESRENKINSCISENKYYCKLHSINDNSGDIPDIPLANDLQNNIPKLTGEVRNVCDSKYQRDYSNYKCLTDCYNIGDKIYHNQMKATGLKIQKNTTSYFDEGNFKTLSERNCENIGVEKHTWEEENDDFSKQSETMIKQFSENGRAKIIGEFKNECNMNAQETAMKKCKDKLGQNAMCYFYKVDGKLSSLEEEQKQQESLCKNTINNLSSICNRDENMNNPDMCNEATVLGVEDNKCYAFQSSNQCYLDYLNGEQYDYFKINNIN
jgi:hypothetical protein